MPIGNNCPRAIRPREIVADEDDEEIIEPEKVLRVLETDFAETIPKYKPYSIEDERFLGIFEDGVKKQSDGRYVMPLPLKSDSMVFPTTASLL